MSQALYNEKMPLIQKDVEGVLAEVAAISVTNDEELNMASAVRMKIREREKRINTIRLEAIAPFKEQVEKYNSAFKGEEEKLSRARALVEGKIENYMRVEELKALEAQRKAREAAEKADREAREKADKLRQEAEQATTPEVKQELEEQAQAEVYSAQLAHIPAEQAKSNVRTEAGTLTRKKVWKAEVYDLAAFVANYPELCMADPKKVSEYVQNTKQEMEAHGLKIFQATQFSGR